MIDKAHQGRPTEPVRITAIEPSGRLYGSEYCLLDIIRGIDAQRVSWNVILPPRGGFGDLLQTLGVPCTYGIAEGLHRRGRWEKLFVYGRLFREVRRQRPQLLYINQAGLLRAGSAICRILGIPGVCQVQTLEDAEWVTRSQSGGRSMMAYICNSDFIAARTQVPPERLSVFYQGVSKLPDYSDDEPRSSASGLLTLGLVGRICESKGHYLTLEAARILCKSGFRFRVRVIGDGMTAEDTMRFQSAVAQAGLAEVFDFRGYCRDIKTEFRAIDLLLIPSLAEPLGRVLYDAALYGVPVIASDSGGLGEICRLYDVGERVPAGNATALASAIRSIPGRLPELKSRFRVQSRKMLRALDMDSYLTAMESLLLQATAWRPSAIRWVGDPGANSVSGETVMQD